jgi:hypothetical protein
MKEFNEFSLIRHGPKLKVGEKRRPLAESGLTEEQQEKWQEAVESLHLEDPELAYDALPKIEELAREIFKDLPENALVMFISSRYPRTKLTTYLLSSELTELSQQQEKDIGVSYFWEPEDVIQKKESLTSNLEGDIMPLIDEIRKRDYKDDETLKKYFEEGGNKFIPLEDELTMKAVNEDLASENSYIRKRADLFEKQYTELKEKYIETNRSIYFYGVTHHSALIALDVAFNGRQKYNSVDEIPKPLSLWKANLKKE